MPERARNQASGLATLPYQRGALLVAMVNHGDEASELPLLWRLCLTWVDLGYPVTVLDAGTSESKDNPGLDQLLDLSGTALAQRQDATVWNVIPAAIGLQTLLDPREKHWPLEQRLGGLFADDGIVVVYGSATLLAQLLGEQTLQPLMIVSSARTSLLSSYQSLKRLLGVPGLTPLVVDQPLISTTNHTQQVSPAEILAECARNFLSLELPLIHLPMPQDGDVGTGEHQRLALRVLENALPLCGRWMLPTSSGAKMDAGQFSRSH